MNTYSAALSLSRSGAWWNDTSESLTSFDSVETYWVSGTVSAQGQCQVYIYIYRCVCVCPCVCLHWCSRFSTWTHQSWCSCLSCARTHLQIGVSSRSGKVSCAPVLIYFREWIGCIVDEHRGRGFQASCCFLCVVAAPEVNVVACSETRPALYQKMEHICVSSSSFCALMSLIWDQSHCRYNDIMCFCG